MLKFLLATTSIAAAIIGTTIYFKDDFKQKIVDQQFDLALVQRNMTLESEQAFSEKDLENIVNFGGSISIDDGEYFAGGYCQGRLDEAIQVEHLALMVEARESKQLDAKGNPILDNLKEYYAEIRVRGNDDFLNQNASHLSDLLIKSLKASYLSLLECHYDLARNASLNDLSQSRL